MGRERHFATWGGARPQVSRGGQERSITVTFNYGGELRALVAPSRKLAFAEASSRWGWGWDGEPCVSSPDTIYNDLTGWTKAQHGQDHGTKHSEAAKRDEFKRTGQPYA